MMASFPAALVLDSLSVRPFTRTASMGIKSQNGEKAEKAEIADRTQLSQNVKHQSDEPTKQEEPTQNQKVVGLGFVRTSDKSKKLVHIESTWMLVLAELAHSDP